MRFLCISKFKISVAVLACAIGLPGRAHAQVLPPDFYKVLVASGLGNPTAMAFAPDGRIFVARQSGVIRIIKNDTLLATPFLQIPVNALGERGLLGLAFDPDFPTNQFIYIYHTLPNRVRNRISRFTANGNVAVPGSQVVILDLDSLSSATNHNGGAMHFKDGKLYVAVGDNALGANAQNLDTYHGKLLRINPDGSVPEGNPFTGGSEQRKRVWAYGLRNPYTFSIQPGTGRIFVNDVGQRTEEEINDATEGGRNFGWPGAEGLSTNPAYTNPVFWYVHGSGTKRGCAITGGTFFNPDATNYPPQYVGKYFFQDYCNRWISALDLADSTSQNFATGLGTYPLAITTGNDGNLYYLERGTSSLYKLIYALKPQIINHPISDTVSQGDPVIFTATAAGTPPLLYQWQKNNENIAGATSTTYAISQTVQADSGYYRLIVSNTAGGDTSAAAYLKITPFNGKPVVEMFTPVENTYYRGGDVISFSAAATDAEDGVLPGSAFTWYLEFHHDDHYHDSPPIVSAQASGSFEVPSSGEVSDNVFYRLLVVAADSKQATDTAHRDILPHKSQISLATMPPGLTVTLDGQPVVTPATITGVEGIERTLGIEEPQYLNDKLYYFQHWLHGGDTTQIIFTPQSDVTYTAVFAEPQVTGITAEAKSFGVFPNPARNHLNIAGSFTTRGDATISLINIDGRTVLEKKLSLQQRLVSTLDLDKVPNGIYLLRIAQSNRIFSRVVVIHR